MESHTKISSEIISEVLLNVFPKESNCDKPNPIIRYNREYLLSTRPEISSESTKKISPKLPFDPRLENIKIGSQKEKQKSSCNFCEDRGHIKKTCAKNKTYKNSIQKSPIVLDHEPGFLKVVKFLDLLQIQPITIPELKQLRTIIDTLIYFHPMSYNQHCPPPY